MEKVLNTDELLDLLGNRTRRRILHLLSERPRFISELSNALEIRRKAVIEHLNQLEDTGLVRSMSKRIEKGRPRKYYEINREFFIKIVLTRDSLVMKRVEGELMTEEIKKIEEELSRLEEGKLSDRRLVASYMVDKIEKRLNEIEKEWVVFQRLLERARRLLMF